MKKPWNAIVSVAVLTLITGCSPQSEPAPQGDTHAAMDEPAHDPHDIPLTEGEKEALRIGVADYEDAVVQIKSFRDKIRHAIETGEALKTHRPFDELDVVLEHVTTVARDSNVPRTQWETINTSAQQLRNLFNSVHAQIDAGETPDYQAVASEIDTAIARLDGVSSNAQ